MFMGQALRRAAKPECIWAGAAQSGEARMHLRAHAAGAAARLRVLRPQLAVGEFLGHVFGDRQRVPHREAIVHQRGYAAHRVHFQDGLLEAGVAVKRIEAHHLFLERDARLLEQDPGTHGPGRIVLVADVEGEHRLSP
jgi:hypothetical protein